MTDISFNSYTGTFQDVKTIWNEKLWPNRKSTIKEMSSMQYLDGFDMAIYEKYKPTFFIVKPFFQFNLRIIEKILFLIFKKLLPIDVIFKTLPPFDRTSLFFILVPAW